MKDVLKDIYIGVDGGATKSIIRIEDAAGNLLGREISGPANIRISVEQSWLAIMSGINKIFSNLNITSIQEQINIHVGMGLAGCEMISAYEQFINSPHGFKNLYVTTDAHIACLGAHAGHDGEIIIIGTGVVGFKIQSQQITKVGGWGFPHDDEGGGAWLGLEAIKFTLQCLDGRQKKTGLADAIYKKFDNDLNRLVTWANNANSTAFAELAPVVIDQLQAGDAYALQLMQRAAEKIEKVNLALSPSSLPCTLIGGLAPFIENFLSLALKKRLQPCQHLPDAGAIYLVRNHSGLL